MDNLAKLKEEIANIGKCLYAKGFVPGTSGNISIKSGDTILITPSGRCLGDLEADDIVSIDFNGNCIEGGKKPSSEKSMHIEIYKVRPDLTCIIHAHAPKATAFAVAGIPLDKPILSEAMVLLGQVPVAEYAMPSSDKLAGIVAGYFINHDCVLLANHGVVTGGRILKDTYYKLETLELYAEITLLTKIIGNSNELSNESIQELIELKKRILV